MPEWMRGLFEQDSLWAVAALGAMALVIGVLLGRFAHRRLDRDHDPLFDDLRGAQAELEAALDQNDRNEKRLVALQTSLGAAAERLEYLRAGLRAPSVLLRPLQEGSPFVRQPSAIPIYAIGNLKSGVGATTLAANLGAFFGDQSRSDARKPALFIDLDIDGGLSAILAQSGKDIREERGVNGGRTATLFDPRDSRASEKLELAGKPNRPELSHSRYFDANLDCGDAEERALFGWLLGDPGMADPRFALARFLASAEVQNAFSAVVIDLSPRATLFTYAGLAAATHVVIASGSHRASVEAADRFIGFLTRGRDLSIWPQLAIGGVAGVNTSSAEHDQERLAAGFDELAMRLGRHWSEHGRAITQLGMIPASPAIARSSALEFAYFNDQDVVLRRSLRHWFRQMGEKLWAATAM